MRYNFNAHRNVKGPLLCVLLTERDTDEAARDQCPGHGVHAGGTGHPRGIGGTKLRCVSQLVGQ